MEENYLKLSRNIFATLSPRQEKILRLRRFEGYTLERTGRKFGLTRQRIHQIEPKIYRKLKHPTRSKMIKRVLLLADKDIWKRLLKQQSQRFPNKTNKNLISANNLVHLARGLSGEEREKFIYIYFFIEILDGGTPGWIFNNSRHYKLNYYTRGNLDKNMIDKIVKKIEWTQISSKELYKIFKKTHFSAKMIIDLHRLIMNLSRDFHKGKIERIFFINSCKNIFALDNPDNWKADTR